MVASFLVAFLILAGIQFAGGAPISATDAKVCIGALNSFDAAIKDGESNVNPKWVTGNAGHIALKSKDSDASMKDLLEFIGSRKNIYSCATLGVPTEEISLFLAAFHGYLPSNPIDEVSECFSGFQILKGEIEKRLGSEKADALSLAVEERVSMTTNQLNYLFPAQKQQVESVFSKASNLSASFARMPADSKRPALKAKLTKCSLYGIPIGGVLEGVGVRVQ